MKTFDWKETYLNTSGNDVTNTARYISINGRKGATGTREDPQGYGTPLINYPHNGIYIFGEGDFLHQGNINIYLVGSSIERTRLTSQLGTGYRADHTARELTLTKDSAITGSEGASYVRVKFEELEFLINNKSFYNCIFVKKRPSVLSATYQRPTFLSLLETGTS